MSMSIAQPFAGGASLGGRDIVQLGFIVEDLDAAVAKWLALGVGPWFFVRHLSIESIDYLGEPVQVDVSIAMAHTGGVQLELIQQHDDVPTVWNNPVYPLRGCHHVAVLVDDYDAAVEELAEQGITMLMAISSGGVRTAYLDGMSSLGMLLEIQEAHSALAVQERIIREACQSWDGADPFRELGW